MKKRREKRMEPCTEQLASLDKEQEALLGFAPQVMNMGEPGQAFVLLPPSLIEGEKIQQFALLLS
jgi:hypothetical protein